MEDSIFRLMTKIFNIVLKNIHHLYTNTHHIPHHLPTVYSLLFKNFRQSIQVPETFGNVIILCFVVNTKLSFGISEWELQNNK
jgi:hypothetical protein